MSDTIPMYGRMIHGQDSKGQLTEESQKYDVHGRYIHAVDRGKLNGSILDELETLPNVTLFFHHKLTGVDFLRRKAWIELKGPSRRPSTEGPNPRASGRPGRPDEIEIGFDLMLGCDGSHSSVRFHMMKFERLDYEQSYIDTLWCEFTFAPFPSHPLSDNPSAVAAAAAAAEDEDDDEEGNFAIDPHHLHIWPGSDNMFIAIPSTDKSFTCTLFAPSGQFAELERDPSQIEVFFNRAFPGAADLIGPGTIQQQFEKNPHLPLISIKCSPHNYGSCGVILGDAAHAMVPFYGQGMNAGLEDVRVLFSHLDSHPFTEVGRVDALKAYNAERIPDAHTINDLALANYEEMHAGVRSWVYLLRKTIEEFLSDKVPRSGFATQYSRVSFSNQRYSEVLKVVARQKRLLLDAALSSALVPVLGWTVWFLLKPRGPHDSSLGIVSGLRLLAERVASVFRR